jgi:hypothetical protein
MDRPRFNTVTAGTILKGTSQAGSSARTGTAVAGTRASGADVFTASRSGNVLIPARIDGDGSLTTSKSATVTAAATAVGDSSVRHPVTYQKTGTVTIGTVFAGTGLHDIALAPVGRIGGVTGVSTGRTELVAIDGTGHIE